MIRKVLAALAAAAVTALVLGGLARVLMRLLTVAAGHAGAFSWPGTLGILAVFFLAAAPGCVVAAFAKRRRRAVLYLGSALLCLPATGVAVEEIGDTTGLGVSQWLGIVAAGAGVYATILALPLVALRMLDGGYRSRTTGPSGREQHSSTSPTSGSVRGAGR